MNSQTNTHLVAFHTHIFQPADTLPELHKVKSLSIRKCFQSLFKTGVYFELVQ